MNLKPRTDHSRAAIRVQRLCLSAGENRWWIHLPAIAAFGFAICLLQGTAPGNDGIPASVAGEELSLAIIEPVSHQPPQTRTKVLLAGIGGWKSCLGQSANDQYISNRFLQLVCNLRRCRPDLDISYVMYCSPGLKEKSGSDEVKVHGRFGDSKVAEQSIGCSIAKHKCSPDSMVFVMGHSHGGWMAMRAAISLGRVDGLYTMEPVSAAQCTTKAYLKNRTRKILKRRQEIVPTCRQAPTDVNRAAVVAATAGNWTNFFLAPNTEKGDIYSSPIPEAHNHMIWAPAEGKYNAHHNLGLSATTWSAIEDNILATLKEKCALVAQVGDHDGVELSSERVWRDDTGNFTRVGSFVELSAGVVSLRLSDGRSSSVRIEALSRADQDWIAANDRLSLASKPSP